jgi:hypothetical protein
MILTHFLPDNLSQRPPIIMLSTTGKKDEEEKIKEFHNTLTKF